MLQLKADTEAAAALIRGENERRAAERLREEEEHEAEKDQLAAKGLNPYKAGTPTQWYTWEKQASKQRPSLCLLDTRLYQLRLRIVLAEPFYAPFWGTCSAALSSVSATLVGLTTRNRRRRTRNNSFEHNVGLTLGQPPLFLWLGF